MAYFLMMIDPCIHGKADPVHADDGDCIGQIALLFPMNDTYAGSFANTSAITIRAELTYR